VAVITQDLSQFEHKVHLNFVDVVRLRTDEQDAVRPAMKKREANHSSLEHIDHHLEYIGSNISLKKSSSSANLALVISIVSKPPRTMVDRFHTIAVADAQ
jgi:hypothetical protein